MQFDRLNRWLTLIANLGVVAGLIFLGYEIRQNTAQMRGEASYSITEGVNDINAAIHQNEELAEINHRGEYSFEELTPIEQDRLRALWFSELNLADYVLLLGEEGIENVQFDVVDYTVRKFRTQPGRRQFWDSAKDGWVGSEELYHRIEQTQ